MLNNTVAILAADTGLTVSPTLKFIEVGSMVAMVLFGVSTTQVYMYFRACGNDKLHIKSFVVVMWLLELVHTFLTGWTIYKSTITRATTEVIWQANMIAGLIAALISAFAQMFFSSRLRKLLGSKVLPAFCCLVSCFKVVSFYTVVIQQLITGTRGPPYQKLIIVTGILSWGNDILIAAGLAWCIRTRKKSDIVNESKVDKVLKWFFETNIVTCLAVSLTFIFGQINDRLFTNFIWVPLAIITCRLYSMCIFASLIGRVKLAEQQEILLVGSAFGMDGLHDFGIPPEAATNATRRF